MHIQPSQLVRCLLITILSLQALGQTWAADPVPSVRLRIALSPVGSFDAVSQAITGEAVQKGASYEAPEVALQISTLRTGIELRDRHLTQKYLEAAKYPRALIQNALANDGKFKAKLTVHGKTREISGEYLVKSGPTGSPWIEARFRTGLSDFEIEEPSYMGVGVENEVEVWAYIPVRKGTPAK
ncbi:MAG: YceI family protein [Oligoflexia bacterium]